MIVNLLGVACAINFAPLLNGVNNYSYVFLTSEP